MKIVSFVKSFVVSSVRRFAAWSGLDFLSGLFSSHIDVPHAGKPVTAATAMGLSGFYACVRVIAETTSQLPWNLFERGPNDTRQLALNNPLYDLIHDSPNPEQTSNEYLEMMLGHCAVRGNAFSFMARDNGGRLRHLWPIHPGCVRVRRSSGASGEILYDVTQNGTRTETYTADQILHFKAMTDDGINGLSLLSLAREQISASIAAEESAAIWFKNGGVLPGQLIVEGKIGKDQEEAKHLKEEISQRWTDQTTGANRHRTPVLDQGMKWDRIGLDPQMMQMLETRNFQKTDFCTLFRVPPHKIGILADAKWANVQQEDINFAKDCIGPWAKRFAARMNHSILSAAERRYLFIEANIEALMKGDQAAQSEYWRTLMNIGAINADEIRAFLNLPPLPNGQGQLFWMPVNMAPIHKILDGTAQAGAKPAEPAKPISNGRAISNGHIHHS